MTKEEIEKELSQIKNWYYDGKHIVRDIETKNFKETMIIVNLIAGISEAHFHHPDVEFGYKRIKIKLMTHSENGITEKDIKLAKDLENFMGKILQR